MRKLIFALSVLSLGCTKQNDILPVSTKQIRIEMCSDSQIVATVLINRDEKIFPVSGNKVKKYFTANVGDLVIIKQYQHTPYTISVALDNAMLLIDSTTSNDIEFTVK